MSKRSGTPVIDGDAIRCAQNNPITDLCCDPFCMSEATQAATPPGVDGLRVLLCDKHADRFVRLANERGIPVAELGLTVLAKGGQ